VLHLRLFDPIANLAALAEASTFVRRYRLLIAEMTRREITDRYAGQVLGAAWAIGGPLLTMAVYVFAFTVLFRGRLGPNDNGLRYTAYVLAAMVPWLALQDVLNRSTVCVSGSASLVKQIVFPTEVLPLKVVLASIPALVVGLTLLGFYLTLRFAPLPAIGIPFLFGLAELGRFVLILLPLIALMPAILVYVGLRGRSLKEAQANISVLLFLLSMLPVIQIFSQRKEPSWAAWMPVSSQYAMLNRALRGDAVPVLDWLQSAAAPVMLTVLALLLASRLLSRMALRS